MNCPGFPLATESGIDVPARIEGAPGHGCRHFANQPNRRCRIIGAVWQGSRGRRLHRAPTRLNAQRSNLIANPVAEPTSTPSHRSFSPQQEGSSEPPSDAKATIVDPQFRAPERVDGRVGHVSRPRRPRRCRARTWHAERGRTPIHASVHRPRRDTPPDLRAHEPDVRSPQAGQRRHPFVGVRAGRCVGRA